MDNQVEDRSNQANEEEAPAALPVRRKLEFSPPSKAAMRLMHHDSYFLEERSPVKNLVSRFEAAAHRQEPDHLPFRTVRSFFSDVKTKSVQVSAEKEKYDAITKAQQQQDLPRCFSEGRVLQPKMGSTSVVSTSTPAPTAATQPSSVEIEVKPPVDDVPIVQVADAPEPQVEDVSTPSVEIVSAPQVENIPDNQADDVPAPLVQDTPETQHEEVAEPPIDEIPEPLLVAVAPPVEHHVDLPEQVEATREQQVDETPASLIEDAEPEEKRSASPEEVEFTPEPLFPGLGGEVPQPYQIEVKRIPDEIIPDKSVDQTEGTYQEQISVEYYDEEPAQDLSYEEEEQDLEHKFDSYFTETSDREARKQTGRTSERSLDAVTDGTMGIEELQISDRHADSGCFTQDMLEQEFAAAAKEVHRSNSYKRPSAAKPLARSRLMQPTAASLASRAKVAEKPVKKESPSKPLARSRLLQPTAASLAARAKTSEPHPKKDTPTKPTRRVVTTAGAKASKNQYANVKSKVASYISSPVNSGRRSSRAGEPLSPTSSTASTDSVRHSTRARMASTTSSVGARSMRSLVGHSFNDMNSDDGSLDWDRMERLSYTSSVSSATSADMDPFNSHGSHGTPRRKSSRYEGVRPRYLDYARSPTYKRSQEVQSERRKTLEEANAIRSAQRRNQIRADLRDKERRKQEDVQVLVRCGSELHELTESMRAKEREARRALLGSSRRLSNASSAASMPM